MSTVWNWLVARLGEPSTWAGIAAAAGAIGTYLQSNTSIAGAVAAAVVAIATAEKGKS